VPAAMASVTARDSSAGIRKETSEKLGILNSGRVKNRLICVKTQRRPLDSRRTSVVHSSVVRVVYTRHYLYDFCTTCTIAPFICVKTQRRPLDSRRTSVVHTSVVRVVVPE
jgi:hypothetical protein